MAEEPLSPGAALVKFRWDRATQAEKDRVGRMMTDARLKKRKGKVRSRSGKGKASK